MVFHQSEATNLEDKQMALSSEMVRMFDDGRLDEQEQRRILTIARIEMREVALGISWLRLSFRLITRAARCSPKNLFDKHCRSELEDIERREQELMKQKRKRSLTGEHSSDLQMTGND